jgi:hypothetical protein
MVPAGPALWVSGRSRLFSFCFGRIGLLSAQNSSVSISAWVAVL